MADSDRYEDAKVHKEFTTGAEMAARYVRIREVTTVQALMCLRWESGQFHLGQFQDECFKGLSHADQVSR